MLPLGHTASSFLLSQSVRLIGYTPTIRETLLVMTFGNLLDVDFFIGHFLGKKGDSHHDFFTHTPIFAIFIWVIFITLVPDLSPVIKILLLVALMLHLMFDEVGHW